MFPRPSLINNSVIDYYRYGSIFKSHLFGRPTIVSCDLELNVFILQNEGKLFEPGYPKPVHDILGKLSMMLVSGELHKRLRSVALSFINVSISNPEFFRGVERLSLSFIDSWRGKKQVLFFKEAKQVPTLINGYILKLMQCFFFFFFFFRKKFLLIFDGWNE